MLKTFAVSALVLLAVTFAFSQDDKSKRPSPPASAECKFADGSTVKTDYSSPRVKGRKIFGGLVPYGQVWRTGANEATTLVSSTDLNIGGKEIPAGSYTLFTVPNADGWKLIVNKKTAEWGVPYKYEADELARIDMKASKLPSPVENFTISYPKSHSGCMLQLDWESTRAEVQVMQNKP